MIFIEIATIYIQNEYKKYFLKQNLGKNMV